jgi:multiple sugar transport system ATP-binding protein
MVFQSYALYPHLTVRDNMGLGLKQGGASRAVIEARGGRGEPLLSLDPLS